MYRKVYYNYIVRARPHAQKSNTFRFDAETDAHADRVRRHGFIQIYWLRKVPIHEILFVSLVTIEVKSSDLHFCKKEYPLVCATVQFHLIFLKAAWYKNALNNPGVIYRLCRIKSLKLLDLNSLKILCNEQVSRIVPRYIELDTLGVRSQNTFGNSAASSTRIKTMT